MMYTLTIYSYNQKTKESNFSSFRYNTAERAFQHYQQEIIKPEVRLARIYRGNQEIFMWHKNIIF